jgi:hypothetical protein
MHAAQHTPRSLPRLATFVAAVALAATCPAFAASVGDEVQEVPLRDHDDRPAALPDFGAKVLVIFYADADVADMNDPLADALDAKKFDESKYRGMGVANLRDSKAPNFIIRGIIKGKVEKYKSTILSDPDLSLCSAWALGNCNNTSIVLVVGKDKKVKHLQRGPIRAKELESFVSLVEGLVNAD